MAMLGRHLPRRTFEPGCSIGLLTQRLAHISSEVLAWDVSAVAVDLARTRVTDLHVQIQVGRVPTGWPDGDFDLVVISELAYYLQVHERRRLRERVRESLEPGGMLLAVHWVHPFAEAATDGRTVHAELSSDNGLVASGHHEDPDFVIDRFTRQ